MKRGKVGLFEYLIVLTTIGPRQKPISVCRVPQVDSLQSTEPTGHTTFPATAGTRDSQ